MMFLLIHFDLVVDTQKYAQLSAYVDLFGSGRKWPMAILARR